MRKTKIVCTIGPACDSKEMMRKMIDAGMNVARINMSHGVYDQLEVTIKNLKEAIAESGQNVAILLDTKGPEVRVGTFKDGSVELVEGAEFSLFKNKEEGDETGVSLSFPKLVDIFESEGQEAIGRELLLDDGIISLVVKSVNPESIVCTVNKGGVLKNRKSINIPGYFINMPYVSAQDRKDIEFGLNHGATVVAASFVRNHDDVRTLRDFIDSLGYEYVEIIAKIENQSGVDDKFDLFSLLIAASISFEVLNIVLIKSKMTKLGKSHDTILLFPKFMIRSALMFLLMHFNKVLMLTDLFLTNVESMAWHI